MRYLVVVVALLACGDNQAAKPSDAAPLDDSAPADAPNHADDNAHDGTRLKIVWFDGKDGTWQPSSERFWDSQLLAYCAPRAWSDGVVRCTPSGREVVFVDDGCTQRLGRAPVNPDNPVGNDRYYIATEWVAFRSTVSKLYGQGPAHLGSVQAYQLGPDGVCRQFALGPSAFFELTATTDDFVPLQTDDAVQSRLAPTEWTSADGMRVRVGVRERQVDFACDLVPHRDGLLADCAPREPTGLNGFSDAGCSVPYYWSTSDPSPPRSPFIARVASQTTGCYAYSTMVYQGPITDVTPYFRSPSDQCVAFTPVSGFAYTPAEQLTSQVSRTVEAIPGRRYQHMIVSTADFSTVSDTLFDTQVGAECRVDGNRKCIPISRASMRSVYDAGCVNSRYVALVPVNCDVAVDVADNGLGVRFKIGPLAASAFEHPVGQTTCVPYVPPSGYEVHEVTTIP